MLRGFLELLEQQWLMSGIYSTIRTTYGTLWWMVTCILNTFLCCFSSDDKKIHPDPEQNLDLHRTDSQLHQYMEDSTFIKTLENQKLPHEEFEDEVAKRQWNTFYTDFTPERSSARSGSNPRPTASCSPTHSTSSWRRCCTTKRSAAMG